MPTYKVEVTRERKIMESTTVEVVSYVMRTEVFEGWISTKPSCSDDCDEHVYLSDDEDTALSERASWTLG